MGVLDELGGVLTVLGGLESTTGMGAGEKRVKREFGVTQQMRPDNQTENPR